jgi:hypothetical protein
MKNTNAAITISFQELQAIMQTVGQLPTQYGAGLYSFFAKKSQEAQTQGVSASKEQTLTSEEEHG